MFKNGVKPAWEDPVNAEAGEFRIDIGQMRDNDLLTKIWETLVFDLVTGHAPCVKDVAGVCLIQKAQ